MPYPNEHAARILDPGSFVENSFRSKDLKNGIRIIVAKLKGETSMVVQAYRFSIDNFTVEQAKKWLEDHKVKFIKFEPAQNKSKSEGSMNDELKHVGVLGMKWGRRRGEDTNSLPRNMFGGKRLSISDREQKRRDVTKKAITAALIGIGGYAIGSSVQKGIGDRKFAAAQNRGRTHIAKILADAKAGNKALDATYAAMKAAYPHLL